MGVWLLLAAFWGLLPGGMAGAGQPLAGEPLCKEGDKLLLCAHGQTGPYLACIQGTGSFLLAGGDEGFARVDLGYPLLGAVYRGGRLFVFREWEPFFCADAYTGSLEQGETCVTSLTADDVALFDCTAQGEVYAVAKGSLQTLQLFSLDGDFQEHSFDKNITLLQVTENGQLWVCTEDSFFMGSSLENLKAITGGRPQRVIGENAFLDSGGNVWQVKGEQAEPVLEGIPPQSLCRADRAGITYADSTGRIHWVLWDGEEAGTCTPDGKPLALTEKGVLMSREGMLYYAPYAFTQEQPSLSPSPSPSVALQKNRERFSDNLRKKEGRLSGKINRLSALTFWKISLTFSCGFHAPPGSGFPLFSAAGLVCIPTAPAGCSLKPRRFCPAGQN